MTFSLAEFVKGAGRIIVIDVESVGLHGEGFAFGAVAVTINGPIAENICSCPPETAQGSEVDRDWVNKNVPPLPITHDNPRALRDFIWERWQLWRNEGAVMMGDCIWPVESNFLSACVQDDPVNRCWSGPYPLVDLAPLLWRAGINPQSKHQRLPGELPEHNPLNDARQSARQLLELLQRR